MNPLSDPVKPSVCLIHDWLITMRGGEKVLEALANMFPEAPIYTLFFNRKKISPFLQRRKIYTSFLQFVPGITKIYRWLLPLFPVAVYFLNVKKFDLVISSSHCVAKAVRVKEGARHVCYCHTPMRYLWGFEDEYLGRFPKWFQKIIQFYFEWLKKWDVSVSHKVGIFISNSRNTANKIRQFYERPSHVIHPPVDLPSGDIQATCNGNYFLIVSALVPYKKIEIAIETFNQLKVPLKIVGDGPLRSCLKKMAVFPGIEFEGWLNPSELWNRYAGCRALIFPGEEDFGIVPVEAQSFGKPVIAYGKGGALETILPYNTSQNAGKSTGLFFFEPTCKSLAQALNEFERIKFDENFIRQHAQKFERKRFCEKINQVLNQ